MSKYLIKDLATEISERVDNPKQSGIERFVGLEHYDSGEMRIKRFGSTSNLESSMKKFKNGDILIARRNVYLRRAGLVEFDGLTSGDSIVIRAKSEIYQRLLPFILNTNDFWDYATQFSDGSMSKRLSPKLLMEYEFELPDDINRKQILSDTLWSISDTLEVYKKLIEKSDELVLSKFIDMFGDPNEEKKDFLITDALDIKDTLRKPLNDGQRKKMKDVDILYPYYGANGLVDYINDYLMDCNAICFAEDCGSYGYGEKSSYIVKGKAWVNNHAHVLIPRDNININFANVLFQLLDLKQYVNGTTRQKLTQTKLKEIKIIIPSIEKQNSFGEYVNEIDGLKLDIKEAYNSLFIVMKKIMEDNLVKKEYVL